MRLKIDDRFNQKLPADPMVGNSRRQIAQSAFSFVTPRVPTDPKLLHVAEDVATMIGLSESDWQSEEFVRVFSGAEVYAGTQPYAMCYGGHQFGSWAGQLGDGRAINLMEVEHADKRWTLQLKGAGETPYSRTADGLAVLRSSVREHLCSEAMFHLGVPTSRSLCLLTTGDEVMRDMMYDGNAEWEPGAVVCRVAPSFIRFGSFEILTARQDFELLKQLADYTIKHFFPQIDANSKTKYADWFQTVCQSTLKMIIHWQRVGFVHGVMNTDNMSIHGQTIDYGPYGWLEGYDPNWTPNTTDRAHRRYRYGNQPQIALWNLLQLANAIFPLLDDAAPLESALKEYQTDFETQHNEMLAAKIGLDTFKVGDQDLLTELDRSLQLTETDMTIFFRNLADVAAASEMDADGKFLDPVRDAFYAPSELVGEVLSAWQAWFQKYLARLKTSGRSDEQRRTIMNTINPKYVLRNYMAQLAIDQATAGDNGLLDELYRLLKDPYTEQPEQTRWFAKRPDWARHKVGCSMLSCSS